MIEVAGLTKQYGALTAIEDVSFRVGQGEIIGFLGPNGAGKSTTMRIITGFAPASRGEARIAGFEVHADPMEVKRRIGYLPERVPLYEEMTVTGFLRYVAEVKGVARAQRRAEVDQAMERCGLTEKGPRLIGNLSKGYRQRVGLAQALLGNPPVLILDEPTVGLDPKQIVDIREMIRGLRGDHTVLISTHILPEVAMLCERVVIINAGRVVAEDRMENLTGEKGRRLRLEIGGPAEAVLKALRTVTGVTAVETLSTGHYQVAVQPGEDIAPALAQALVHAGLGLQRLEDGGRTLEDVFMEAIASDRKGTAA